MKTIRTLAIIVLAITLSAFTFKTDASWWLD